MTWEERSTPAAGVPSGAVRAKTREDVCFAGGGQHHRLARGEHHEPSRAAEPERLERAARDELSVAVVLEDTSFPLPKVAGAFGPASATMVAMSSGEAVYEMFWDCKYCGQKKLLGVTHRFCANCGAPQDPAARYFPPDHEKVPVHDHPYVGADVACPACRHPMSRAAKCCTNCGSPLDKGTEVARRADVVVPPPGGAQPARAHGHAAPTKAPIWLFALIGGVLFLVVGSILVAALWKREGVFEVTGHSWERTIAIERYEALRKNVWCDDAPAGARVLSRKKEQRGTKKEQDGEVCGTRKQDLGNGAYKEVKECTPKYKDVPVMDEKCEVEVTAWVPSRKVTEKGESLAETPRWPVTGVTGGTCLGCEREGARTERYTVEFVDQKTKATASCDVPEARWSSFAKGSKYKGKVRVVTGGVDCDELERL